eukprot:scaffold470_cov257-Pinguiococcus_pyrenoidosus.AAC.33
MASAESERRNLPAQAKANRAGQSPAPKANFQNLSLLSSGEFRPAQSEPAGPAYCQRCFWNSPWHTIGGECGMVEVREEIREWRNWTRKWNNFFPFLVHPHVPFCAAAGRWPLAVGTLGRSPGARRTPNAKRLTPNAGRGCVARPR